MKPIEVINKLNEAVKASQISDNIQGDLEALEDISMMTIPSAWEAIEDGRLNNDKDIVNLIFENTDAPISNKLKKYLMKGTSNIDDLEDKVQEAIKILNGDTSLQKEDEISEDEIKESVMKSVKELDICNKLKSAVENIIGDSAEVHDVHSVEVYVYNTGPQLQITYDVSVDLFSKLSIRQPILSFYGPFSVDEWTGEVVLMTNEDISCCEFKYTKDGNLELYK